MLLPNSLSEYKRLQKASNQSATFQVIPNGIDEHFFKPAGNITRDPNLIICAARIEGIKNQLTLIKALNHTKYTLLLIGSPAPNQKSYYEACKRIAAGNIQFIEHISQSELKSYYQRAAIHILPSWFETTGLSSLEAAAMGCKIVVSSKGDTTAYFEDMAVYCDPSSPQSIFEAINEAAAIPFNSILRDKILSTYTWQQATEATLHAYEQVIPCYESTYWHTRHPRHPQSLRRI